MKTFLIVAGILVIVLLLGFRILYGKFSGGKEERTWYTQQLHYNFSAEIDTVIMLRGSAGLGRIVCTKVIGEVNPSVEESLNYHLTNHKSLRLLKTSPDNKLEFLIIGAEQYLPGDSLFI